MHVLPQSDTPMDTVIVFKKYSDDVKSFLSLLHMNGILRNHRSRPGVTRSEIMTYWNNTTEKPKTEFATNLLEWLIVKQSVMK